MGTSPRSDREQELTGDAEVGAGRAIVLLDIVGTVVFVVTALLAAVVFNSPTQWVAAIVALVLFLVGIGAFLWSFYNAVQRSRAEQVAVTQLYLHVSGIAPKSVRVPMLLALAVQTVVGLGTAIARANAADGSPGTSLALGVLVPMFGFGLNGLWSAYHGDFEERPEEPKRPRPRPVRVATEADAKASSKTDSSPETGADNGPDSDPDVGEAGGGRRDDHDAETGAQHQNSRSSEQ